MLLGKNGRVSHHKKWLHLGSSCPSRQAPALELTATPTTLCDLKPGFFTFSCNCTSLWGQLSLGALLYKTCVQFVLCLMAEAGWSLWSPLDRCDN